MKKVIIGFLSAIGFLTLLIFGIIIWKTSTLLTTLVSHTETESLSEQTVLSITVGGYPLTEYNFHHSVLSQLQAPHAQSLLEIVDTIREAKKDPHIKGILLSIEGNNIALAQATELRESLLDFQKEKKPVYTFAYAFSESSSGTVPYYLASLSDEIYMQPTGTFSVTGFSLESYFLKNLLDDFKIKIQSLTKEKYKGAIESFTRSDFSPNVKDNLQTVLNTLFDHVKKTILSSKKGLTKDALEEMIEQSPHLDYQAVQKKYITNLDYKHHVKEKIKTKISTTGHPEAVKFISVKSYINHIKEKSSSEQIGVIVLDSDIKSPGQDPQGQDPFSPEGIEKAFQLISKKPSIKAIVFRINCPGGSVSGSETIWNAVKHTVEKGIPVVVSMSSVAASGGYYIAAPATRIFALPTTLTGSIGVAFAKPNIKNATEEYGITWDKVEAGNNAGIWSMTSDFTPQVWERIQDEVSHTYLVFKDKVAKGRKLDKEHVQSVAQGLVWSGLQAKDKKLVDKIGGFFDAVEEAKTLGNIKVENPELILLNQHTHSYSMLFDFLGSEMTERLKLKVLQMMPQSRLEARLELR